MNDTEQLELIDRLVDILQRTAIALKGPEGAKKMHDWSDLPEVAAREKELADRYRRLCH